MNNWLELSIEHLRSGERSWLKFDGEYIDTVGILEDYISTLEKQIDKPADELRENFNKEISYE